MTIQDMINKARVNAVIKAEEYYKEVCGGICNYREEIEADKLTGEFQKEVERFAFNNIMECIRVIKKTKLMTEEQKEEAINMLHETDEYKTSQKEVARIFAEHFVKFKNIYLA